MGCRYHAGPCQCDAADQYANTRQSHYSFSLDKAKTEIKEDMELGAVNMEIVAAVKRMRAAVAALDKLSKSGVDMRLRHERERKEYSAAYMAAENEVSAAWDVMSGYGLGKAAE